MTIDIDTVIIGAGAAGLTVGKRLAERGIPFEILDDHPRIGDSWRERYGSLRLFTPRSLAELRGLPLDIGYFDFPTGTQFAAYLERYAERFALPVRLDTRVRSLTRTSGEGFRASVSRGDDVVARRAIVTAGAHRTPVLPAFATRLDPRIRQLHSLEYRGPDQLEPGPVLVVGAANSGTDIALEAAGAGHVVTLAGRYPGRVPGDIDNPIGNLIARLFIRHLLRVTIDTEKGRARREASLGHGVNLVRNSLRDLDRAGVLRLGRITGVDATGRPVTAEGEPVAATTVVWCTGSRPDFSWIRIDGAMDTAGWPAQYRGVSDAVPGLAFVGLPFQYSVASPTLMGMGVDADYVVDRLFAPTAPVAAAVTAATAS